MSHEDERIEELEDALDSARDALATLAAAGIVVGEDGAVRSHGLTGAEIEGMEEALMAWRRAYGTLHWASLRNETVTPQMENALYQASTDLYDALAAAAGRGADGEAGGAG